MSINYSALILAVQSHRCLYDFNIKKQYKPETKQAAWDKVAKVVGSSAEECKKKWRILRMDYYRSIIKPASGRTTTKKTNSHLDKMKFLERFLRPWRKVHKKPAATARNRSTPSGPAKQQDSSTEPPNKKPAATVRNNMRSTPSEPTKQQDSSTEPPNKKPAATVRNNMRSTPSEPTKQQDSSTEPPNKKPAAIARKNMSTPSEPTKPQDNSTEPPNEKNNPQNTPAKSSTSSSKNVTDNRDDTNKDPFKKQFLLSLLSDLEEMDATHFRMFKIKVSELINRVIISQQTKRKSLRY